MSTNRPFDRATSWRLRTRSIDFETCPALMGIVNVTPDSFSDGGRFGHVDAAVKQALKLADEGAAIIDIGGESTRPYSTPVDIDQELARVLPVVDQVCAATDVPVSIDTSKAAVARAAVAAGAEIINDVTGFEGDPDMLEAARELQVGVCAMHMQGTPQTMQDSPHYGDVVQEIHTYLAARRDSLLSAGIENERICLDPGIGFGKTHEHNLTLLANCHCYHDLGCPVLVGHSRKGFIGKVLEDKEVDRDAATAGAALALAAQGVQVIRVHNVALVRQALLLFEASGGLQHV